MPFELIRNDITAVKADAIVNSANPHVAVGAGVDLAIHRKAGPKLLKARGALGDLAPGQAVITEAFGLDARYVIHTVGPVWRDGQHGEMERLRDCYERSLRLATEYQCVSVAFPLISTGTYGFPKSDALQIAMATISAFLMEHDMMVYLVVYDSQSFALSEKLFQAVSAYIDENYVEEQAEAAAEEWTRLRERRRRAETTRELSSEPNSEMELEPDSEADSEADSGADFGPDSEMNYDSAFLIESKAMVLYEEPSGIWAGLEADSGLYELKEPAAPVESAAAGVLTTADVGKAAGTWNLEERLRHADASFSEMLLRLIDQKGKTDVEVYKRANLDRKLFSKIRSNPQYKPSKRTAAALAIALELNLDETRDLLRRAGFALSHCDKFDIIIEYFIEHGNYDIYEVNEVLFAFGQATLGI